MPRPETETLVERALALLAGSEAPRVLDVGVGSGAIALALADERPDARVTGVDVSAAALELAAENAARLGLAVELREGGIETAGEGWDLVAANPPYVATLDGLQPELRFEPETALVGDGLPRADRPRGAHALPRARGRRRRGGRGRGDAAGARLRGR